MDSVKTILFVENDPVALTMYQNRLEREGFHVETAGDGLAAMRALSAITPDAVVLDLMLPRFSGTEVLKFMRVDVRLKNVPVVIFSNAAMTDWPAEVAVGTTRCLPKTDTTFPILLQTIQDLMAAAPVPPAGPVAVSATGHETDADNIAPTPVPVKKERGEFLQDASALLPKLRESCLAYIKAPTSDAGREHLALLHHGIRSLNTDATAADMVRGAMLTQAMDRQLSELVTRGPAATPSVLQTLAQAMDCLRVVLQTTVPEPRESDCRARVLAVDDDAICNHVIESALSKTTFEVTTTEDPISALELVQSNVYDIVLLDVNMPKLNGFELCEKLRRLACNKFSAVIFVTAFNSFENRKQSVLSGGEDFIAKPVSAVELALKVTLHVLKAQSRRNASESAEGVSESSLEPVEAQMSSAPPAPAAELQIATTESRNGTFESLDAENAAAIALGLDPEFIVVDREPVLPPGPIGNSHDSTDEALLPTDAVTTEAFTSSVNATSVQRSECAEGWISAAEGVPVLPAVEAPTKATYPDSFQLTVPMTQSATDHSDLTASETVPLSQGSPGEGNSIVKAPQFLPIPSTANTAPIMKTETNQAFEKIVIEVARIIFGDQNLTELNLRLVRMALERHNVHQLITGVA